MRIEKRFISANELLLDSYRLAKKVYTSGIKPDLIVGVWRGGSPIAIAVHEYFDFKGLPSQHCAIKAASYYGIEAQHADINLSGIENLIELFQANQTVLLVDDVFDTGRSYRAIREQLRSTINELNIDLKLASVWYKPENNLTEYTPDIYLNKTEKWLVFPHELCGLTTEEIKEGKGKEIAKLLES